MWEMSLRDRKPQWSQVYETHLIVFGLFNIRISLGKVFFRPFSIANFLNSSIS